MPGNRTPSDGVMDVVSFLPARLRPLFVRLPPPLLAQVREVRLRVERPIMLAVGGDEQLFVGRGGARADAAGAETFHRADAGEFLQIISRSSVYALEEQFRQGFITLPGGHRVGLCGETALEDGRPRTIKHVGSFNLRIARAVPGAADGVIARVARAGGRPRHTLIISPPGGGKTTMLRDIARQLSSHRQVSVIDERSEIAACWRGVPQLDVGPRTDVVDGCPKAVGIMLMLRAMAPDVIVTDEIGRPEDVAALLEAMHAGVGVIASAHGSSWDEVASRPALAPLLNPCAFELVVVLGDARRPGAVEAVLTPGRAPAGRHTVSAFPVHMSR